MPSFCGLMSCWHMEPRTASTIMWPQKITCDHQHSETGSFEAKEQPRVLKTCGISKLMDSEAANFWTFLMPTQHLRLGVLILSLMCTKPRLWASPQTCFLNSVLCQCTPSFLIRSETLESPWNFFFLSSHIQIFSKPYELCLWNTTRSHCSQPLPLPPWSNNLTLHLSPGSLQRPLNQAPCFHLSCGHPILHVGARVVL